MIFSSHKKAQSGFTLIELAIVLSIVGTVVAGLWRISANSSQQSKDQATAQQQIALINATKGFLNDQTIPNGGQDWLKNVANFPTLGSVHNLPIPAACPGAVGTTDAVFCNYLPPNFVKTTTNPYGQIYTIQVKAGTGSAAQNYSFMTVTSGGTAIPDADGGRISGLIGSEGGFIYTAQVCAATVALDSTTACGNMGAWSMSTATGTSYMYGVGVAPATTSGMIASMSTPASTATLNPEWLARVTIPTDPLSGFVAPWTAGSSGYQSNTMTTDIFMGTSEQSDTPPTTGVPAMHLHTGFIEGDGSTLNPQINLEYTAAPTSAASAPYVLIHANSQCSVLTTTALGAPVYNAAGNPANGLPYCNNAIFADGDIGASGQILSQKIYSSSDARLKMNIRPITNGLEGLMKISPVSYAFKASGSKSMGVTAQDLEKVYPELVSTSYNGNKYVEYNGLIGPLISAVQELKHQNDDMRKQLHDQSARIKELEQKNTAP